MFSPSKGKIKCDLALMEESTTHVNTILIVEDEYANYLFLSELLERTGIKLIHAKNGMEAVDFCKADRSIDLILMDIKMPVMDGQTAAKIIKSFRPNLPILAQTAYAMDHEIAMYAGDFEDYITKPIRSLDFEKKLMKYIEKPL